jgi:hypothetical protein
MRVITWLVLPPETVIAFRVQLVLTVNGEMYFFDATLGDVPSRV